MKGNITAVFLAAALLISAGTPCSFQSIQVTAEEDTVAQTLPQWLPKNFDTAWTFSYRHGSTYILDGLLCTVFPEYETTESVDAARYQTEYSQEQLRCISSETYQNESGCGFQVSLYQPIHTGDAAVCHTDAQSEEPPYTYSFYIDDQLMIRETDPCGWVPNSFQEFQLRLEEDGALITQGNQIAFLLQTNDGTGYHWQEQINDPALAECIAVIDCNQLPKKLPDVAAAGKKHLQVLVYEAKKDGELNLTQQLLPPGTDAEPEESLGGVFRITDSGSIVLKPGDARISIIDVDTGLPVVYPFSDGGSLYLNYRSGEPADNTADPAAFNPTLYCRITSNPGVVPIGDLFSENHYSLWMSNRTMPSGYSFSGVYTDETCADADTVHVTQLTDSIADITMALHFTPEGDLNDDGNFSIADAVLLQRLLLTDHDASPAKWKSGDFVNDDRLDARDLSAMLQKLLARAAALDERSIALNITAYYGGYGAAGQILEPGSFETSFTVLEGDCFYEAEKGIWYQNVRKGNYAEPILRVKRITEESVTVDVDYHGEITEKTLLFGETAQQCPTSRYLIYDGINYTYDICFSPVN